MLTRKIGVKRLRDDERVIDLTKARGELIDGRELGQRAPPMVEPVKAGVERLKVEQAGLAGGIGVQRCSFVVMCAVEA